MLAEAVRENRALTGFSCFGNPDGFEADENALRQAVIDTRAPLQVWNNNPLSSDIVAERNRRPPTLPSSSPAVPAPSSKKGFARRSSRSKKESPAEAPRNKTTVPPSVASSATRKAFEDAIKNGGSAPWMRSKLMMVGEGRAGKSSTVRSFQGKPFDPKLESTLGADTSSTVTVDRLENVIDWTEREKDEEFARVAARSAARKMRNLPEAPMFAFETTPNPSVESDVARPARRPSLASKIMSSFRGAAAPDQKKEVEPPSAQLERLTVTPSLMFMPEEEIAKRFDEELVAEALSAEDDPMKRKLVLSIWDYGGQEVFYALHHVFLTRFGVYCVVFDMSRMAGPSADEESKEKCIELVQFWLRSIYMHAKGAPTFLVGTHKDVVSSVEDHRKINKMLSERLGFGSSAQVVVNEVKGSKTESLWFFPIDNLRGVKGDPVIQRLREKIVESVKEEKYIQMAVPLPWIRALDLLLEQRKTSPFLALSKVAEMAAKIGVSDKIRDMLRLFHELGVLSYFDSSPEVRQFVVLEPQWIVNAFTKVIRDMRFHPFDTIGDVALRSTYAEDVGELNTRGIVSKRLLFYLWAEETDECRDFLLALMRNMSMLCDWVEHEYEKGEPVKHFLVPSLFELDLGLCTMVKKEQKFNPEVLFDLNFERFFLPRGLFPRLVALVVSHGAKAFEDSAIPFITRTRVLASFGDADFSMEPMPSSNVIRIGVLEAKYFDTVSQVVVSMVEDLRDTVMGEALKMDVHLLVPDDDGDFVAVDLDTARKARNDPSKARFRAADGRTKVEVKQLDKFFKGSDENQSVKAAPTKQLGDSLSYDFFISYYTGTGKDQAISLGKSLENAKFTVWLDQFFEGEVTEAEMRKGVDSSKCLLVFLSKGVFTREFCLMEMRRAKEANRPILFVHEIDPNHPGFAEIYDLRDREAPEDLQHLFKDVDSIGFQRKRYLEDAMIAELTRRWKSKSAF